VGIPVEVPGLSSIIPEFDSGRVFVVESGADPAKSFFVRQVTLTAQRNGIPVTFVTSRDRHELESLLERESGARPWIENDVAIREEDALVRLNGFSSATGLLVIDSFSFLTLGRDGLQVAELMRELRTVCRERSTIVLLATDRGMSNPHAEAVVAHLADGVLEFHSREGPEGLLRFLRIPKWTNGKLFDRNIHYEFDGRRIAVDLRSRVL
jgi:KaiC/GvpD/RAD55 family RecA-like ATPase